MLNLFASTGGFYYAGGAGRAAFSAAALAAVTVLRRPIRTVADSLFDLELVQIAVLPDRELTAIHPPRQDRALPRHVVELPAPASIELGQHRMRPFRLRTGK